MKKLNDLFYSFLQVAASTQKLGINLIRISTVSYTHLTLPTIA